MQWLEETERRKANRAVWVNCYILSLLTPTVRSAFLSSLFSIETFFTAFESWATGVVLDYSKSKQRAKQYKQKSSPQS